jgi:sulfur-carrier protein adenylyltransferase/sulfurtransferase
MDLLEMQLIAVELEQYSRHLKLPGFGLEKQLRLKSAKVLLVGAGGLGCPIGLYLAAAGVGTIGVADFDRVERSNLQRQIAHGVSDVGRPKVDSLIEAMRTINPLVAYQAHPSRLSAENAAEIINQYDLVLDGSDNFATRFLLADACYLSRIPLLQGAVYEYEAQLCLFVPNEGPCYRCVFREPPTQGALAPCAEVGILGVVPGTAGLMMATEAIKYLTGMAAAIQGRLLIYDGLNQSIRHWELVQDADCPLCGSNPSICEIRETQVVCPSQTKGAQATVEKVELTPLQARQLLNGGAVLLDVREVFEFNTGHIAQATHIPLSQLKARAEQDLPAKTQPILAYCQKGQRSLEAVRILTELGYQSVFSLAGGISAWDGSISVSV